MLIHSDFTSSYLMAFVMGLFSSMHCIGMCGSIIGTLTLSLDAKIRSSKPRLFAFVFNYNLGRIISYTTAGALAGLLSQVLSMPFDHDLGYRCLQIASALMMGSAGLYIAGWFPRFAYVEKTGVFLWKKLEPFGHKLIPVKTPLNAFLFGTIWGWLPCGLVYAALIMSATTGDILKSAVTMLAFGLGTLPAVVGIGIMTVSLQKLARQNRFRQIVGVLMILLALSAAFPWLYPMRIQHHLM
ncbi:MAG: sulfite exporter TauE/SafE family protein [Methylococcales bacterium]|nr:sulfite exporter TauE/SafE family protein [Methylococcales bacterium]